YRIYRGELDPASAEEAQKDLSKANWKKPLALLASSTTNRFPDAQFDFGTKYAYVVRSVVVVGGTAIESGDSSPVVVTPRDTFPPAPPQGLVAIFLASGEPPTSRVELSWSMNVETDLAGYRVYRSEQEGVPGQPCSFPGAVRLGAERGRRRPAGGPGPGTCSPVSAPSATPASVGFAGGCGVQLRLPSPLPFLFGPPRSHRRLPPFYDREHCLCHCRHAGMGRQPDLGRPRSP